MKKAEQNNIVIFAKTLQQDFLFCPQFSRCQEFRLRLFLSSSELCKIKIKLSAVGTKFAG